MNPTAILSQEHRAIEVALDILERLSAQARQTGLLDRAAAQEALEFLTEFADRMHHGKEEALLFPGLIARGLPKEFGPIAVMLNEHDVGRAVLGKLRTLLSGGDVAGEGVARFARVAADYVELLREHIAKEDDMLFPMGERMLSDAERAQLVAQFVKVDADVLGAGGRDARMRGIEALAKRVGVPTGPARSAAPRRYSCGASLC